MAKQIKFTIHWNQEKKDGNPIPYTRTTQGSQWTPKAQRYHQWKTRVVAAYLDALQIIPKIERADFGEAHDLLQKKPIRKADHKQKMEIMCYYSDETHPDTDNVFKGIADALFMNDKHVIGSFDYTHEKGGQGRVEVTLYL